jgi:hypothetical protein
LGVAKPPNSLSLWERARVRVPRLWERARVRVPRLWERARVRVPRLWERARLCLKMLGGPFCRKGPEQITYAGDFRRSRSASGIYF